MTKRQDKIESALQACLEDIQTEGVSMDTALAQYPDLADELRPQLEAALWLASRKQALDPRPGFLTSSRRRLVRRIGYERPNRFAVFANRINRFLSSRRVVQVGFTILLAAILLAGNTVARAAQSSIPGDTTYPVKVTLEQVRQTISFSEAAGARQQIASTQRRLSELESLILEGRYQYLASTVTELETHIDRAIAALNTFNRKDPIGARQLALLLEKVLSSQTMALVALEQMAPEQNRPEVEQAIQASMEAVEKIQEQFLQ